MKKKEVVLEGKFEPVAEPPVAEEAVVEEPAAEEAVAEEAPAVEAPVAEEAVVEEPAAEEAVAEEAQGMSTRAKVLLVVAAVVVFFLGSLFGGRGETSSSASAIVAEEEPAAEEAPAAEAPVVEEAVSEAPVSELPDWASPTGFAPIEVDNWKTFRQGLPAMVDFRDTVIVAGDDAIGIVYFGETYEALTLQRAVADDVFTGVVYYPANGDPINILPLLEMTNMFEGCPSGQEALFESRGVNCSEGEILSQNVYSVFLGNVEKGSYLVFRISDNPELGVNNGSLATFSADTDPMTLDFSTGNPVENPSFVPEGYGE